MLQNWLTMVSVLSTASCSAQFLFSMAISGTYNGGTYCISGLYKVYVREYPHIIWLCMVQYLNFRILEFLLTGSQAMNQQNVSFPIHCHYMSPHISLASHAITCLPSLPCKVVPHNPIVRQLGLMFISPIAFN